MRDEAGRTALHRAALAGNERLIKSLLEGAAGPDVPRWGSLYKKPHHKLNTTCVVWFTIYSANLEKIYPDPYPDCFFFLIF